ncbi:hypothetical protein BsWGS_00145 [Bradybaena similaris]
MDTLPSLDELHVLAAELKASYGQHNDIFELPANLEGDLQSLLQTRKNLKAEYLKAFEEKLVLNEFEKKPEEWMTVKAAETQLLDSKDILMEIATLSNRTDRVQETVDLAADALHTLKEKLEVLEQKIAKLQEKYLELSVSSVTSIESMQESVTESSVRAISELLTSVRAERDNLQGQVKRMEATLNYFEQLSSSQSQKVAFRRNELAQLEEKLHELEQFSGLRCRVKNETSIDIELLSGDKSNTSDEASNSRVLPDDARLIVTVTFQENEQSLLELENVQLSSILKTSQMQEEAEALIKVARLDKDLPKLITGLKTMWMSHVPQITEISQIRSRHAIDWIKEKGLLLLMPRKSNSVVCALKVPSTYPFCGHIALETVMGQTSQVNPADIQPPSNVSLTGWVMHLESLFGQP